MTGQDRFRRYHLDYTSDFVEQKLREKMSNYTFREHIEVVLKHLKGEAKDHSGLPLQETVTFLLSWGIDASWREMKLDKTNTREWRTYNTQKQTIKHLYDIATEIQSPNQMLVSTNPGFPVADSVFSQPMSGGNIDTTQISWQDDRPFTLRALYRFRRHYLKVPDSTVVRVSYVAPTKEANYSNRVKSTFLSGDIASELKYSEEETVSVPELEDMWRSTHICVIKPRENWDALLQRIYDNM